MEFKKGQVFKCRESEKRGFERTLTIVVQSVNPNRWWVDSYNSVTKQTRRITVRADRLLSADCEPVVLEPKGQIELAVPA